MQEAILTNVIHFAPIGILALLLIMVLILVANLRQTKKINKKLTISHQKMFCSVKWCDRHSKINGSCIQCG